ncbi:interleukin-1 receptor-associated kinase 4 [Vigna unguiculata]|uniref:Interleukin-1 receptor-associated kinase 4 n=1 Tax=Vigna unguiculata TaxID=3917 RepID=A0A4D6KRK6_VIGUN|nr:interleukin-1 receptor-associated kinase 4 [Vigna unguiculata]
MASLMRQKLFSILMFYLLGTLNILPTETASTFRHYNCTQKPKFSPKSSYQFNLNKLLSKLESKVNSTNYYYTTVSGRNKQDTVYGLFMCNGYMEKCGECVNTSIQTLKSKCIFNKEAIIWTHECLVRYTNMFFFNTTKKSPSWCVKNSEDYEGELDIFNRMLSSLMKDLLTEAIEAPMGSVKFAVKKKSISQEKHFFGFAQCVPYLSKENCRKCLRDAMDFLQTCARGKIGGRVIYPSCIVRYDHYLFFPLPRGGEEISTELNSLQFELSTIQEATNKFSDDNKIGEGGFGAVYKGVFSNGLEIAVKRLKKNSSQGATEFKKEVLLISKLQHRNLVRLLGFCVQRNEKILIYEFVHNESLDYYLFSPQNHRKLSWSERYEIIRGIARGILYLHEDSHLNIIHCDLKPSNILLDNKMNAKISDFGLARIISIDQMQGNTSIISGTYGYMSPEYAMLGQFSMKSDVFSFGVIILEIISGKRNVDGNGKDLDDLLSHAWKKWKKNRVLELLDPSLQHSFSETEINKCVQIGLLCVQGNPDQRPIMAKIAFYFSCDQLGKLPLPQEPAFFMRGKTETKDF